MSGSSETAEQAKPTRRKPLPPSPCVGICVLDEAHGFCSGCGRTPADIAQWPDASKFEKSQIWRQLPGRLIKLGVHSFRLPAPPERIATFVERSLMESAGVWQMGLVETPIAFDARGDIQIYREAGGLKATNDAGQVMQFVDHDRVRAFGLADPSGIGDMSAVALALPRGRAEIAADDVRAADEAIISLPVRCGSARFELHCRDVQQAKALRTVVGQSGAPGMDHAGGVLRVETVLGAIAGPASAGAVQSLLSFVPDDSGPEQFGIAKAFAVCAVFRANDNDWLAAAIAP